MNNASFQDVISYLRLNNLSSDQYRTIVQALNDNRKWSARAAIEGFYVGQAVSFKSRFGGTVTGTVTKVNRASVAVRANVTGVTWKVSPTLLTRV